MVSHKGINNNQDAPSECHHASIYNNKWRKSDFCPRATRANPSSSFPEIPQKECLGSWDKSHQRASSGPLRASAMKGRSPLHFQFDQILQFPICVLKNLMVTRSAYIHTDRSHSHDKESLSGRFPLRQTAKRVTSRLRDVLGARGTSEPCSETCFCNFWLLARLGASILQV